MDEAFKRQATEWFARGDHDIETARLLYEAQGYTDVIAYHIHQAIEKYLKGFLVQHGNKPPRTHELDTLLNLISTFDKSLDGFIELAERATKYYMESRYPPGPPIEHTYKEVKADLDNAAQLVRKIKEKV